MPAHHRALNRPIRPSSLCIIAFCVLSAADVLRLVNRSGSSQLGFVSLPRRSSLVAVRQQTNSDEHPSRTFCFLRPPSSFHHPATLLKPIWDEVYKRLGRDSALVNAFQKDLVESTDRITQRERTNKGPDTTNGQDLHRQISAIAQDRLDMNVQTNFQIKVGKEHIAVGEQVCEVVQTITRFKDNIVPAVTSKPHAFLAWAGILTILLLVSNPVTQTQDAVEGLATSHVFLFSVELWKKHMTCRLLHLLKGKGYSPLKR
ncbi:hypothetical protein BJX66DRAFT_319442 [Aspergillus keveii]|uniref:NWD NACHT-NTPase N-terminal domain-containing protein n=1 Tax=Aspergillus keveii TaxID=714993 RepID=A0ABR4FI83_9EURO